MVAIGVTGHRVLAELDELERALDAVTSRLERAFPGQWTVVSALAEGADRLVANRLLSRGGTRLVAMLPMPAHEYETDFDTVASREEFHRLLACADEVDVPSGQRTRDEAYEAGGLAVLARADVLVAVWDGQGAQGRGGTGAIVAAARARGLPIAWVHAGNRTPATMEPTSLGDEQGEVTFERWPDERRQGSR